MDTDTHSLTTDDKGVASITSKAFSYYRGHLLLCFLASRGARSRLY